MFTETISPVPLQGAVVDSVMQAIGNAIAFLPTVLGAIAILIVGFIIGRILGGIVTRIVRKIGLTRYTEGTAMEEVGSGDGVARALGKIVTYYVYFVALLAAANVLGIAQLTDLLAELGAFLPVILGALIVLVIGFVVGRIVGDIVADVVGGFGIGKYLAGTPLERLGDTEGEFGSFVGKLVTYYIYLLTLVAVVDILEIAVLADLFNTFAGYLPALVAGLLVLLVGIWAAERAAEVVRETDDSRTFHLASLFVKVVIYYITVTLALATIGINITILTTLFTAFIAAFFGALAIALALGIGLAVGLGGQDYVAENIDDWVTSVTDNIGPDDDSTNN